MKNMTGNDSSPKPGSPALSTTSNGSGRSEPPKRLRYWLIDMIDSGDIPGLQWENSSRTVFRIPWKHAGKNNWKEEDCKIFKAWAEHRGKYRQGDKMEAATWKTRLRCALNKLPDIKELRDQSNLEAIEPYRVYQLLPEPAKAEEDELFPRSEWGKESVKAQTRYHHPNSNERSHQHPVFSPWHSNMHTMTPSPLTSTTHRGISVNNLELVGPPIMDTSSQLANMTVGDHPMTGQEYWTLNQPHVNIVPPGRFYPLQNETISSSSTAFDQTVPRQCNFGGPISPSSSSSEVSATPCFDDEYGGGYDHGMSCSAPDANQEIIQPSETQPQPHEMEIYIKYRGNIVISQHVDRQSGCRVYYGDSDMQQIAAVTRELPSAVFGSASLQQIGLVNCEPYMKSSKQITLTKHVLTNINRGLIITYENGCFYARRLCQSRVFLFGPESRGDTPERLERNLKVKVFDYRTFCDNLRKYAKEQRARPPETELMASFGQNWSIKNPIDRNLVTLFMIPRAAKFLLHKVRQQNNLSLGCNDSILASRPDSYDLMAADAIKYSEKWMSDFLDSMIQKSPDEGGNHFTQLEQQPMAPGRNTAFQSGYLQETVLFPAPLAPVPLNDVEMNGVMQ